MASNRVSEAVKICAKILEASTFRNCSLVVCLTIYNKMMYLTFHFNTQNHQVTLDGRSCFLQGDKPEIANYDKVVVSASVLEVSIWFSVLPAVDVKT